MPRTWIWLLGGFAIGLLLFLLVFLAGRRDARVPDPADAAPPTADGPAYTALPSPLPADADGASGMGDAPDALAGDEDSRPHLVEAPPPPPVPAEPEMPLPDPVAVDVPVSPTGEPTPIPGQTPPPRYPATSLRRGETGTVLVRATIGVDGRPRQLDIARSSGYRRLDRAAMDAVRRWRFQPAQANGQPVEASVNVPIEFTR
ncbi:energy transducer TonB [Marilutibacter spongiae]|uniref:Energy transducer TonB n=1 Tax=Marilutibacter spongiae TaxID=2025720 RepID=A0A7W3TJC0_9GAMM|nr:energy transducer TonB [Lysobacter spongiae]MBB1059392.1 energy transducer TonB [Lysobacter spongiae]